MSVDELANFALLREMNEEDRGILLEHLEERSLAKGRTLFRQRSESDGLLLVRAGALRLKRKDSGDEVQIAAHGSLGGLSLVAVGGREATAVATEACDLWVLGRTSYRRLTEDYPRTAIRLTEALLAELASHVRAAIPELDAPDE